MSNNRQKQAKLLRIVRKIHRIAGIWLFLFLFVTGITGLLLGWKKNSFGMILADTASGINKDESRFLKIDTFIFIAHHYAINHFPKDKTELDRIEVRPDKGIVKVNFKKNYTGLQIDATDGRILVIENRNADLLEHIHDGTWFDRMFDLKSGAFKLFYTTVCGMGLIVFTVTGFWLWYGPKLIRNQRE